MAKEHENYLAMKTLIAYSAPGLGIGMMSILYAIYLFKYCTDVLLIAPGVIGALYGCARAWDAISDPIVGYLSDATRTKYGRRRLWLIGSIPFLAISFYMLWCPPESLSGVSLTIWIGAALLLYSTATTCFNVPHLSLGMELTPNHHERTRVFAYKHAFMSLGGLFAFIAVGIYSKIVKTTEAELLAETISPVAFMITTAGVLLTVVTIYYTFKKVQEVPEHLHKGSTNIKAAFKDIWRNPHAKTLLYVHGIQSFGLGTLAILVTYVLQYIVKAPPMMMAMILSFYAVPTALCTPIWIPLSKRFGKKTVWHTAMVVQGIAFTMMFFVSEGSYVLLCADAVLVGLSTGCALIIGPSIKADIIDYDELSTDQRKEGSYLAVWAFTQKMSMGLAAVLLGLVLQAVGFEANTEQPESVQLAIKILFGIVPGTAFFIGAFLFKEFKLNETEHNAVRASIDQGFIPK